MACVNKQWRVKVYLMGGDGDWIDNGTGYLEINVQTVSVYNEDTPDIKILDYIVKEESYKRQGETILTWEDQDGSRYALSFQEKTMAHEALEALCRIQGKNSTDIGFDEDNYSGTDLKSPSIYNLTEILDELTYGSKERNAEIILQGDFLGKLREVSAEHPEDVLAKEVIFKIYKQLCMFLYSPYALW